jgi:hypothetical protein
LAIGDLPGGAIAHDKSGLERRRLAGLWCEPNKEEQRLNRSMTWGIPTVAPLQ